MEDILELDDDLELGAEANEGNNEVPPEIYAINIFDSATSILYKWASQLETPVKYLVNITPPSLNGGVPENKDFEFESLLSLVASGVEQGGSLEDIRNSLISSGYQFNIDTSLERELPLIYYPLNPDAYNEIQNYYQTVLKSVPFDNPLQLRSLYSAWLSEYNRLYESDRLKLRDFLAYQIALSQITPSSASPPTIDSSKLIVSGIRGKTESIGNDLTLESGLDIFNQTKMSFLFPFVHFRDYENKDVYKMFNRFPTLSSFNISRTGSFFTDKEPDYTKIIPSNTQDIPINTFNFSLLKLENKKPEDIIQSNRKAYIYGTYDLKANRLTIKSSENPEVTLNPIFEALPLTYDSYTTISIKGEFVVFGINIQEYIFLDIILNDPQFNTYFFVDETKNGAYHKAFLRIKMKALVNPYEKTKKKSVYVPTAIRASITNERLGVPLDVGTTRYAINTPIVKVNFGNAIGGPAITQFISILTRLFSYYHTQYIEIGERYRDYIPELTINDPMTDSGNIGGVGGKEERESSSESSLPNTPSGPKTPRSLASSTSSLMSNATTASTMSLATGIVSGMKSRLAKVRVTSPKNSQTQEIKKLRDQTEDLLPKNYSRVCTPEKRPILIRPCLLYTSPSPRD